MKKQIIPFLLFIIYLFLLIKILLLKDLAMVHIGHIRLNFGGTQEGPANLIPFKTIIYYLKGKNGFLIATINILGNIIALVPLGFLIPFILKNCNWSKIIVLSIFTGLIIELSQLALHIGIFDIDDVILNAIGVIIGFWKFNIFSNFSKKAKYILSLFYLSISTTLILFGTLSYYKIVEMPIGIEPSVKMGSMPHTQNRQGASKNCCDLCNGTGGTGIIVNISENSITIRSASGKDKLIYITPKTELKNSNGVIAKNILKLDDHVTVVIDEMETASLILVCGIAIK